MLRPRWPLRRRRSRLRPGGWWWSTRRRSSGRRRFSWFGTLGLCLSSGDLRSSLSLRLGSTFSSLFFLFCRFNLWFLIFTRPWTCGRRRLFRFDVTTAGRFIDMITTNFSFFFGLSFDILLFDILFFISGIWFVITLIEFWSHH